MKVSPNYVELKRMKILLFTVVFLIQGLYAVPENIYSNEKEIIYQELLAQLVGAAEIIYQDKQIPIKQLFKLNNLNDICVDDWYYNIIITKDAILQIRSLHQADIIHKQRLMNMLRLLLKTLEARIAWIEELKLLDPALANLLKERVIPHQANLITWLTQHVNT